MWTCTSCTQPQDIGQRTFGADDYPRLEASLICGDCFLFFLEHNDSEAFLFWTPIVQESNE